MFQALFSHHQKALHKQQLVYFVRIMSALLAVLVAASRHNTHKMYQSFYMHFLLVMSK
jgi:hypothetical protein